MRYNINFKFAFTPNDKPQAEYKITKEIQRNQRENIKDAIISRKVKTGGKDAYYVNNLVSGYFL